VDIKVEVGPIDLTTVVGEHRVYDDEAEEYRGSELTLGQAIAHKVFEDLRREDYYGDLKRKVAELRTEVIKEQIAPVITKALADPIQQTNQYGEARGKETTLRALIVEEVGRLLKSPADQYSRDKGTWLQALVRSEAEAALRKELGEVIAEEKAKVVAAVRGKAADLIAESIKAGLGK
jgi:hypothetical protein